VVVVVHGGPVPAHGFDAALPSHPVSSLVSREQPDREGRGCRAGRSI